MNVQNQAVVLEEQYEVSRNGDTFLCCCSSLICCGVFFGFSLQKLKEKNLDEWKNIRGPRPWEDSRQYQEEQRSR